MQFPHPVVEQHSVRGVPVLVVRDDLCSPFPGPNFSKIRGIYEHLRRKAEDGVRVVVSQDTSISRCGWAVSYVCHELGLTHYNICAVKAKAGRPVNFYQRMSQRWGGKLVPVKGTFTSAMRAIALRVLRDQGVHGYMIPNGLSVPETLHEHAAIIRGMDRAMFGGTVVVCVSSGTICAGILYGLGAAGLGPQLVGITSSAFHNRGEKIHRLVKDAVQVGARMTGAPSLRILDAGYRYTEMETEPCPFPCDRYLDRKTWAWIGKNVLSLPQPVVFWNIGGEWHPQTGLIRGLRGDGLADRDVVLRFLNGGANG